MISTREIKRKIKTIRNIQQICRAMKTVSLVKLQKTEVRLTAARPYAERMGRTLASLLASTGADFSGPDAAKAVIVITSDKGLCGGYNASVLRRANREIDSQPVVPIGKKAERALRRRGNPVIDELPMLGSEPTLAQIAPLADRLAKRIQNGEIAELTAVYGNFLRGTRSEIVAHEVFPIRGEAVGDVLLEPGGPEMTQLLIGRYMRAALYLLALESSASEHGARVAAMSAASDNAEEMISSLTMDYNRARQATITRELTEIVGSAEALSG